MMHAGNAEHGGKTSCRPHKTPETTLAANEGLVVAALMRSSITAAAAHQVHGARAVLCCVFKVNYVRHGI